MMTSLSCYGEKEFQISSFSKVPEFENLDQNLFSKILIFSQFKTKWSKIRVNTPLRVEKKRRKRAIE